jgi:hypothetical protein
MVGMAKLVGAKVHSVSLVYNLQFEYDLHVDRKVTPITIGILTKILWAMAIAQCDIGGMITQRALMLDKLNTHNVGNPGDARMDIIFSIEKLL